MEERGDDASAKEAFELQTRMFERGAGELETQVARFDELLFKVKAGAITVWVALMGWAVSTKVPRMTLLGLVVVVGFWLLEALFRGQQLAFVDRLEVQRLLNDRLALNAAVANREFPKNLVYPLVSDRSETQKAREFLRGIASPSVATFYLFLGLSTVLVWLGFDQ